MNLKNVIGLMFLIFIFIIACAGTPEQLSEADLSFNPNEPWTGTWELATTSAAMYTNNFVLKLKQDSNLVYSVKGSDFKFKGKVVGNRLEGRFRDDEVWMIHDLNVKISDDLKSFEGKDLRQSVINVPIKGVRQD
jgi:hypothetical protein